MDDKLIDKLQKILALTNSPVEGEAQAAAEMLQKFLQKHNLDIADLERKGQNAPTVREQGHDLGKAAFKWKLDLAEAIAEHYFCVPMVNRHAKTVAFVGRPENVEALQMLYGWLIDQIKRISAEERRNHLVRTNEHIDPLRWQVQFGIGAVDRLATRLRDQAQAAREDADSMALVVHHETEISDWLEETYGYRKDGKPTKEQATRYAEYDRRQAEKAQDRATMDDDAFYAKYPYDDPNREAKLAAADPGYAARRAREEAEWAKADARSERSRRAAETRRANRYVSWDEIQKERQSATANRAGREASSRINLQPFVTSSDTPSTAPQGEIAHVRENYICRGRDAERRARY